MTTTRLNRVYSAPLLTSISTVQSNKSFSDELDAFYRANRCPYNKFSRICGREIDLHLLYTSVVKRGGYKKVCEDQEWHNVAADMQLPSVCTNVSVALRRIYYKALGTFEKHQCPALSEKYITQQYAESGLEPMGISSHLLPSTSFENAVGIGFSQRPDSSLLNSNTFPASSQDINDCSGRLRSSHYKHSIIPPWSSCLPQNNPTEDITTSNDPSSPSLVGVLRLKDHSEVELIELALLSGLPNEVDVALNSLLVLSATGSMGTGIRFSRNQRLLRLLLASVGIYDDDFSSLISCDESWHQSNSLNFLKFWNASVTDGPEKMLLRSDVFINYYDGESLDEDYIKCDSSEGLFAPVGEVHDSFNDAFQYENGAVNESLELSRVLLVSTLLVNLVTPPSVPSQGQIHAPLHGDGSLDPEDDTLYEHAAVACSQTKRASRTLLPHLKGLVPSPPLSQWRDNIRFLSSSPNAIRFIFLCVHSRHYNLKQLGLQLVSNLQYPLHPPRCLRTPQALMIESLQPDEFWRTPWSVLCANDQDCEDDYVPSNGCLLGKITLNFISSSIEATEDRNVLLSALQLLANMSRVSCGVNTNILLDGISPIVWARISQLLCLPDLALVCSTLEALYNLTNLGTLMCRRLWQAALLNEQGVTPSNSRSPVSLISALIALVNLEGQAMGAGSLHRVKLMQRIPPPPQNTVVFQSPNMPNTQNMGLVNQSPNVHQVSPIGSLHDGPKRQGFGGNNSLVAIASKTPPLNFKIPISRQPSGNQYVHGKNSSELPSSLAVNNNSLSMPQSSLISLLSSNSNNDKQKDNCPTSQSTEYKPSSVCKSKSLSELTDRLQMPPPTMPPPSVLRRANRYAKSPQSSVLCNGHYSPTKTNVNGMKEEQESSLRINGNTKRHINAEKDCDSPMRKVPKTLVNGDLSQGESNGIRKDLIDTPDSLHIKDEKFRDKTHLEEAIKLKENDISMKQDDLVEHNKFAENSVKMNGEINSVSDSHDNITSNGSKDEISAKMPLNKDCDKELNKMLDNSENHSSFPPPLKNPPTNAKSRVIKSESDSNGVEIVEKSSPVNNAGDENEDDDKSTVDSIDESDAEDFANLADTLRSDSPSSSTSNNSSNSSSANSSSSYKPGKYLCEWGDCSSSFDQVSHVAAHVYSLHLKNDLEIHRVGHESFAQSRRCCMWRDCSSQSLSRAKFALMSHVLDIHCSESELESRCKNKGSKQKPVTPKKQVHPNMNTNNYDQSGWSVIRQVELRRLQSDLWLPHMSPVQYGKLIGKNHPVVPPVLPPREGPVTKHLRVTAALVLQNLVTFLDEARSWVWKETPMLCEIAFGSSPNVHNGIMRTNDAANIIARCLYLSNQPHSVTPTAKPCDSANRNPSSSHSHSIVKSDLSVLISKHPTILPNSSSSSNNSNVTNKLPNVSSVIIRPELHQVDMDQ